MGIPPNHLKLNRFGIETYGFGHPHFRKPPCYLFTYIYIHTITYIHTVYPRFLWTVTCLLKEMHRGNRHDPGLDSSYGAIWMELGHLE